ncbi:MAG: FtsX-like permease family protein, partial [Acidimicrobiales bacterium]
PGLASVLFLADGAAAAALAAGGAILGLYLSARRRRYEYAALTATGLSQRTLRRALAAEQIAVLAFGMVVGVATGLVAAAVALPAVPEFVTVPLAPALTHRPPAGEMALVLAAAVLVVLLAAGGAAVALTRGVRLEQLREAPA